MGRLTKFSIENSRFLLLAIVAVLLAGMATFFTQARQEDPEITIRSAQVTAKFPGMSPERIEQLITRPIEEEIKRMPEVKKIKSVSMTGVAMITLTLHDRYFDLDPIWSDLRNKMKDMQPRLPDNTQGPFVNDDFGRVSIITLALTGRDYDMREMRWTARKLRDQLATTPLVARVDLYGIQKERIWLEFDPALLTQIGLTPVSIFQALKQQNIVLPGGAVKADGLNIIIEPSGNFDSVEDIRNVTIKTPSSDIVYLRDILKVRRGYVDPPQQPVLFNGKPAIVLGISMVQSSNIAELGDALKKRIAKLRSNLPLGLNLDVITWQPDLVEAAVNAATLNLGQTIAVVLVMVMLFLGLRLGLIVVAMVPLSIMLALVGMNIMGIELHRISIAAIIIALGLLVDNGIVVVEDISVRIAGGTPRKQAAVDAAGTLAIPLLTSSLTTILAFTPLMLAENTSGEYLRSLALVIMLTLLSSWIIAITVIPAMCVWLMPDPKSRGTKVSNNNNTRFGMISDHYRNFLGLLLRVRIPFLIVMVAAFIGSVALMKFVNQRHMGPSERNQFTVYVNLPAGVTIKETQKVIDRLAKFLSDRKANPEITSNVLYIASGGPRFFLALSPPDPQPNLGFGIVTTQNNKQVASVMNRINRFIAKQLPEAEGRTEELFLGPAPLGTVELRVLGPEIGVLRNISEQILSAYHSVKGTGGIRSDWENSTFKIQVVVDQARARRAGVTSEEIARALSAQIDGISITDYREGDKVIPVVLRAGETERNNLDRLRTIEIFSASRGVAVPLMQVADFKGIVEPSRIVRWNQTRAITIAGKHQFLSAKKLYAQLAPRIARIKLPPGYRLEKEGEIKTSSEANGALFKYAPHCLFAIIMLLVLQFNSFRRPLIIGLTIPLILIGSSLGLLIFDAWFDFAAMLGIFSLAGIIINNGIVMIDKIDHNRNSGMGVDEAVINAALSRSRPIIMTTLTTILGLVPLALFGGEFWHGMAIVIMGGLFVGTILTLAVVPVLYSLLFQFWRTTGDSLPMKTSSKSTA